MNIKEPDNYNPHVHPRPPRTRVELLAWENEHSEDYHVRVSAAIILIETRLRVFSHSYTKGKFAGLRRERVAKAARALRRYLKDSNRESYPSGKPAFLKSEPDPDSVQHEVNAGEHRTIIPRKPNYHE